MDKKLFFCLKDQFWGQIDQQVDTSTEIVRAHLPEKRELMDKSSCGVLCENVEAWKISKLNKSASTTDLQHLQVSFMKEDKLLINLLISTSCTASNYLSTI